MAKQAAVRSHKLAGTPGRGRQNTPDVGELAARGVWTHHNLLDLDDFSASELSLVLDTADAMKEILSREVPRVPALRGTSIVTLFYEESTRTRSSFELAGKILGADVINIAAKGSSVEKGESLVDTVLTLQAVGANVLIMRHNASGAPYLAARHARCAVINAGDGWHAHPTQALLDAYTIRERFGDLKGRKVVIVGDIAHSRVARSNLWSLTTLGADVVLCMPPTLLPAGLDDTCLPGASGERLLPSVRIEHNLRRAVEGADVIMALRLQKERQTSGLLPSLREYSRLYQVTTEHLAFAGPDALVMHPGPMNEGVEISADVAHSARSLIEDQVTNGVAVRMAVLYLMTRGARAE